MTQALPQETLSPPILEQSVRFGERYVSSALNRKMAGVFGTGVYHGFNVRPSGVPGYVLVVDDDDYPHSVAIVERDGFSLTVSMKSVGYVNIPAPGEWYIVIEAYYIESQPGYQWVVARQADEVKSHHVVLARVTVDDISAEISAGQIDLDVRVEADMKNLPADFERLKILHFKTIERHARFIAQGIKDVLAYLQAKNDIEDALALHQLRYQQREQELRDELNRQQERYEANAVRDAKLLTMHTKVVEQIVRELESRKQHEHEMDTEIARLRNQAEQDTVFKFRAIASSARACKRNIEETMARIEQKNKLEELQQRDELRLVYDFNSLTRDVRLSARTTRLEYEMAVDMSASVTPVFTEAMSPAGYTLPGGVTVAPVTIVDDWSDAPKDAALVMRREDIPG